MTAHRSAASARGFTLVELLIAALATVVVIAGAVTVFMQQQRLQNVGSADRGIQERARIASEAIVSELQLAGLGIDRALTFDFGDYDRAWLESALPLDAGTGTFPRRTGAWLSTRAGPFPGCNSFGCRDHLDTPDQLAFRYADPSFSYALARRPGVAGLPIVGGLRTPLRRGEILLVVCYDDPKAWAYVTVGRDVPAADPAGPPAETIILLEDRGAAPLNAFPFQNETLGHACFHGALDYGGPALTAGAVQQTVARVFKVISARFFVQSFPENGVLRPYLMVDRGTDPAGAGGFGEPVAPDVEDLQVEYLFPRVDGRTKAVERRVGGTQLVGLSNDPASIDLVSGGPTNEERRVGIADSLANQSPDNIYAVRIHLVVRSPEQDTSLPVTHPDVQMPAAANRAARFTYGLGDLLVPYYRRFPLETTVYLRNAESTFAYTPYFRDVTDPVAAGFIVGGR